MARSIGKSLQETDSPSRVGLAHVSIPAVTTAAADICYLPLPGPAPAGLQARQRFKSRPRGADR